MNWITTGVMGIAGLTGSLYALDSANPGDMLHSVETEIVEEINALSHTSVINEALYESELLIERLAELETVTQQPEYQSGTHTAQRERIEQQFISAITSIEKAESAGHVLEVAVARASIQTAVDYYIQNNLSPDDYLYEVLDRYSQSMTESLIVRNSN